MDTVGQWRTTNKTKITSDPNVRFETMVSEVGVKVSPVRVRQCVNGKGAVNEMDYEGRAIFEQPDRPDTFLLRDDVVLTWTNTVAPLVIPLSRRGRFTYTDDYILTLHLVYLWSRGAPDWIIQVYDNDTDQLIHQQTEGIDSYANRVSTLNEQIIVPSRNLRFVALREDDNSEDLTILAGSFVKIETF